MGSNGRFAGLNCLLERFVHVPNYLFALKSYYGFRVNEPWLLGEEANLVKTALVVKRMVLLGSKANHSSKALCQASEDN